MRGSHPTLMLLRRADVPPTGGVPPADSHIQTGLRRGRKLRFDISMTLKQACSSEYQGAQGAFKDSMIHGKSAIHITYRDSLRPSSMREPRDPLLKVV
jgi:hypothetical protein